MQAYETLYLDYDKEYIDNLKAEVEKFVRYKLMMPWWAISTKNLITNEGGFDLLVLRGITYVIESTMNGVQSVDPMIDGLRRFSQALAAEYGANYVENQHLRFSTVDASNNDNPLPQRRGWLPSLFGLTPLVGDGSTKSDPLWGLQSDYSQDSHLDAALAQLSQLERELFTLYTNVGQSIKEVCEMTGRNYNTVKPQISRIRSKLKKLLSS